MKSKRGSALVVVLWVSVLLGFLAAQHVAHNRDKASSAIQAMEQVRMDQTIQSIIDLYRSGSIPFPEQKGGKGTWNILTINDVDVFVRLDKESRRTLIGVSNDAKLRELIRNILIQRGIAGSEKDAARKADELTDAMLDWIDEDDLRRTYGAEDEDYLKRNLNYLPANGPFRTFTEVLLVMGMSEELFWGDPLAGLINDLETSMGGQVASGSDRFRSERDGGRRRFSERALGLESAERQPDFWDAVTIYPNDVKRLTLISVDRENGYWFAVIFLSIGKAVDQVLEDYRLVFPENAGKEDLARLILTNDRLQNSYWKRYRVYQK